MLKISDDMIGRSPFIDWMLYLFQVTSEEVYPTTLHVPTKEFEEYINILYTRSNQPMPELIVDGIPLINVKDDVNHVVLAFSGGKDSVAHAAFLKDYGMNPILYHIKRINRSYPNETNVAHDIANMLQVPIVEDYIQYSGKVSRAESPVKNHLILSLIIEYMRQNNLTRCACGTYFDDNLARTPTYFGLSDAYEFYLAFEKGVKSFFPNFKWLCWFNSEFQAVSYLVHKHPELIPHYQSCILPDRYRKNIKAANERKYHIELLPNRCLSCWKCAQEYSILSQLGYLPPVSKELEQHILDQFRKDLPKVMDEKELEVFDVSNDAEVINHYILYDDYELYHTLDGVLSHIDFDTFK